MHPASTLQPAGTTTPGDDDVTSSIAAAAKAPALPAAARQADVSQAGGRGGGEAGAPVPVGSGTALAAVCLESSGDGSLTGDVLQRLEHLEALVGGQLDQLSAHHGERIAAIKVPFCCYGRAQ